MKFKTPLMFASIEDADSSKFRGYLFEMEVNRQLDRIILDEAYLILTAKNYRAKLGSTILLRRLQYQIIYLTAILPPIMKTSFLDQLRLRNPELIRSITFRKNIQLRMDQQLFHLKTSFDDWCYSEVIKRARPRDDQSRFIIYCRFKKECESLAKLLNYEFYYSGIGSIEEKSSIFERGLAGEHVMICCTQNFGTGLDYSRVDGVFFIGPGDDSFEFLQITDRTERSGQDVFSVTLLDRLWKIPALKKEKALIGPRKLVIRQTLLNQKYRARALSEYIDGVIGWCENEINQCDVCEKKPISSTNLNPNPSSNPNFIDQSVTEVEEEEKID